MVASSGVSLSPEYGVFPFTVKINYFSILSVIEEVVKCSCTIFVSQLALTTITRSGTLNR